MRLHGGREDDGGSGREHRRRDEIVREARRELGDNVRGGRGDHDDIGLTAHCHMAGGALVLDLEHLDLDRTVGQRLEREGPHEFGRRPAHHHLHRRAGLDEPARELDRLVRGDRPGHAEHDEAALQRIAHTFSS